MMVQIQYIGVRPGSLVLFFLLLLAPVSAPAATFVLPTPNRTIFSPGGEEKFFAPTPGRTWESGTFGCVRTEGNQLHEGLDILVTRRDARGEPLDEIYASASGRVAYLNNNAGLSNYGKYIILQHQIEGIPVFTTYAHLGRFAEGLTLGAPVKQGQVIGTMGRTSNTRQAISKERAHLHFEIGLRLNERFAAWHSAKLKGQRNDHGNWNGRNFLGLDPREVFMEQQRLGSKFSFLEFVRSRSELCRVLIRDTKFSWLREYTPLVRRNPVADREGAAAYEVVLDFIGIPFLLVPKARSEIGAGPRFELLSVNGNEQSARRCRKLVLNRSGRWQLAATGEQLLDLLTY